MRRSGLLLVVLGVVGLPALASAALLFDGSEFQVNTYTTSSQFGQTARSVGRAPDGSFVVVWQSYYQDGSAYGVHGQRYNSAGAAAGTEFQVNTYTTNYQSYPAVAVGGDGSFVVVWNSYGQDGDAWGIRGQRYSSAGAAVGTEFQVNSYTTYGQYSPSVAAADDGSFVVVWNSSAGSDGNGDSIQAQRFTSAGAPSGTEFQVNSYTTNDQYEPAVSAAADGSFVVVWSSYGTDGDSGSVRGQRFTSAGAPAGSEFQVNTYTTYTQRDPAVSVAATGDFVVVWESRYQDGDGHSVNGQRFTSAGAPAGGEFQVNTYTTNNQRRPAVSAAADGSFVVVWNSDGSDGSVAGVQGQRYTSAGAAAGTEFQVNTYTTNYQGYSNSIAVDAYGDFVVVWESRGQDGEFDGMFGQLLCQDSDSNSICDSAESCGISPATGCLTGAKASFAIKVGNDPAKDKFKWKLSKGGAFDQAALGDPVTTRKYLLCIYDSTGNTDSLAATVRIDPNAAWTSKDPRGFQYKDKTGAEDGVTKAQLKTGAAGRTSASVAGKGTNIPMPAPVSATAFFNQDSTVTVQLINHQTSTCWTSAFTTAKKNDGVQFKATAP